MAVCAGAASEPGLPSVVWSSRGVPHVARAAGVRATDGAGKENDCCGGPVWMLLVGAQGLEHTRHIVGAQDMIREEGKLTSSHSSKWGSAVPPCSRKGPQPRAPVSREPNVLAAPPEVTTFL